MVQPNFQFLKRQKEQEKKKKQEEKKLRKLAEKSATPAVDLGQPAGETKE